MEVRSRSTPMKIIILTLLLLLSNGILAQELTGTNPEIKINLAKIAGLESFQDKYAQDLKKEFLKDYNEAKEYGEVGIPWSLELSSELRHKDKFLALELRGYIFQGGAHGMHLLDFAYFHPKNKTQIAQEKLLVQDAYAELSKLCRQNLIEQGFEANDDWMLKGTKPIKENYRNLIPEDQGLRIYFSSYQIAPYAAGIPTVLLPWSEARTLFREEYRP